MSNEIFSLEGISVVREGRYLICDVNWVVHDHERWVVLGPNGAGKTTMLQVASTYMTPTRGSMRIFDLVRGRTDVRVVRERIGYAGAGPASLVHQEFPSIEIVVTGKHAAFVDSRWHDYTDDDWVRGKALLAQLHADHLADRKFSTLSQGERQRVLVARSLMAQPELLLLDEATTGLDLGSRERLVASLADLAVDPDSPAVVLVTHHVEEIPPEFTHILILRDGRVLSSGPIADTLTAEVLGEAFDIDLRLELQDGRYHSWSPRA